MKENVFDLPHGADNPRNSEGSFLLTKDGRIRFIYTRYTGTSWGDHASADLAEIISDDGGTTWHDRGIVIPRGGANNIMSVSLLRLQDGSVRIFYLEKNAQPSGCMSCIPMMRRSDDEGESWSEAKRLIPHEGYYVMNNDRAIQLDSGRIVLPLAVHPWRTGGGLRAGIVFMLFSDDNGATWETDRAVLLEREPDHGYCYTAMLFHGDSLLLAYCCGRHGKTGLDHNQLQDLRIRKITVADLWKD